MKKTRLISFLLIIFGTMAVASGNTADTSKALKINPTKSSIKWTGTKVTGEHYGKIQFKEGTLETNSKGEPVKGRFVVDMTSMNVGDLEGKMAQKLVGHLNSNDFFMVSKYKESVLEVSDFKKISGNKYQATGNLTIKKITKPISFEIMMDGKSATTSLTVDRTKYDIKYGSGSFFKGLGDKMIHDTFKLDIKLALR